MTDQVIISLVAATGSVVASIVSALGVLAVRGTRHALNSRLDELVKLARAEGRSEGIEEGERRERERFEA